MYFWSTDNEAIASIKFIIFRSIDLKLTGKVYTVYFVIL